MNRPSEELTERELELMHVFWKQGELSAQAARDQLETNGRVLTYTTVATLCRILWEKGYIDRIGDARPFTFRPLKSFIAAIAWAIIQVTLLCSMAIVLARLFRNRSPQTMTSILSGTP
jgi:predicted transcriptional regulator